MGSPASPDSLENQVMLDALSLFVSVLLSVPVSVLVPVPVAVFHYRAHAPSYVYNANGKPAANCLLQTLQQHFQQFQQSNQSLKGQDESSA